MAPVFESMDVIEAVPTPEILPAAASAKPRVWTSFTTFLLAAIGGQLASLAVILMMFLIAGVVSGIKGGDPATIQTTVQTMLKTPLIVLLVSLVPFQVGMILVVLAAAWLSKEPFKTRLGFLPPTGRKVGSFKLATMACFTLSIALTTVIASSLFLGPLPAGNSVSQAIADGSWWTITLLSVLLSVIPALVEETVFRGFLQRRLLARWSPVVAIGVTTLLFAMMHFDSLQHIIAVVPLSIVTGMLAYRTGSTKPGMIVHAAHNTGAVIWGAGITTLSAHVSQEVLGLSMIGIIAAMGLIGLPAVVMLFLKSKKERLVAEPVVDTRPVAAREPSFSNFGIDSRLAGQMS